MAYAIYTAVLLVLLYMWRVLLCTAVCAYFVLRTVHELYCTQFTHHSLHSFCLYTAEFSWVPAWDSTIQSIAVQWVLFLYQVYHTQ